MDYDFGTKQVAAGHTENLPNGETQKFEAGVERVYGVTGDDPFLTGRIKFSANPDSAGLSANLGVTVTEADTGVTVGTPGSVSVNASSVREYQFPVKQGVKYRIAVKSDHPYASAVLWSPLKAADEAKKNTSNRG